MIYTDQQLKQALAKMLPDQINYSDHVSWGVLSWKNGIVIDDAEYLKLCWDIENELDDEQILDYVRILLEDVLQCFQGKFLQHFALAHATWQQKVIALTKLKGIEI